jgi:hypothetical protein
MSTQPRITEVPPENPVPVTALGLKKRVQDLDEAIKLFAVIATPEQYTTVANYGRDAAGLIKEAEAFYADEIATLYRQWKNKTGERASITDPAERIKSVASRLCGAWQQAQERLRLEEERRQEEAQRKLAEDEAINTAAALEKEGRVEEAEAIISTPVDVAPVSVASNVPRVQGVSKPRERNIPEVTSLMLLVKAVAEGKVPLKAIEANMVFLRQMATALGTNMNYPGVKVKQEAKSAFRG